MRNVSVHVTGAQLTTDLKQRCLQFKKRKTNKLQGAMPGATIHKPGLSCKS